MVKTFQFSKARPVWINDLEKNMNTQAGFSVNFDVEKNRDCLLRATGATYYRIYVNGRFIHYGPARAPHGFLRVDILDIKEYIREGKNNLYIEAAGYYCGSFYSLKLPSFVNAEIVSDGEILAYSGSDSFMGKVLDQRKREVIRYSHARTFTEIYTLDNDKNPYMSAEGMSQELLREQDIEKSHVYIENILPIPCYDIRTPEKIHERGCLGQKKDAKGVHHIPLEKKHSGLDDSFPIEMIKDDPFSLITSYTYIPDTCNGNSASFKDGAVIAENEYVLLDMGLDNTGFIITDITAEEDSEVCLIFDEKLVDGRIAIEVLAAANVVKYNLKASGASYTMESFEPYVFRYIACIVSKGRVKLNSLSLREYSCPDYNNVSNLQLHDAGLSKIFNAAVESYRQNTLDVFMDSPGRERGGWLADSYFTAQSAQFFSGNSTMEKVMLENYVMPRSFPNLPPGMLPKCYPAEWKPNSFIPQWAMWYFIQFDDYFRRSGERDKNKFKSIAYGLLNYLGEFRNSSGLLENLDGWNFVEWSKANEWVKDVSYPTNMLYSKILDIIGRYYGDKSLIKESADIRDAVIEESFNGSFFVDNAVRSDGGSLRITSNTSETCQYYSFFFDIANPEDSKFQRLRNLLMNDCGPGRKSESRMPELAYSNMVFGIVMRMELLLRWGMYEKLMEEIKEYFAFQAEMTGTLWELYLNYKTPVDFREIIENGSISGSNSLNHGFISVVGTYIIRSMLGIRSIDNNEKRIVLDFGDVRIKDVSGSIGVGEGLLSISRKIAGDKEIIEFSLPDGYACDIIESDAYPARSISQNCT